MAFSFNTSVTAIPTLCELKISIQLSFGSIRFRGDNHMQSELMVALTLKWIQYVRHFVKPNSVPLSQNQIKLDITATAIKLNWRSRSPQGIDLRFPTIGK